MRGGDALEFLRGRTRDEDDGREGVEASASSALSSPLSDDSSRSVSTRETSEMILLIVTSTREEEVGGKSGAGDSAGKKVTDEDGGIFGFVDLSEGWQEGMGHLSWK